MKTILSAAFLGAGAVLVSLGSASAVPADAGAVARVQAPADIVLAAAGPGPQYGRRAGCAQGQKRSARTGYCRPSPAESR